MPQTVLIVTLVLIAGAIGVGYWIYKRHKRNRIVGELLSGKDLLGQWAYSADEWRQAVEHEFDWAKASDSGGVVYFSPVAIYIKSASSDRLIDLSGSGKVVTHASYRGTEDSPLKIRVRWKVIERNEDGLQQRTKYYKEDHRIPVPLRNGAVAMKVAEWFSKRAEENMEAYADLVASDEAISIFGDDSF